MARTCLISTFVLLVSLMGAGLPVGAAPRPVHRGQKLLAPVRVDLDAGEYAAFRFDPKSKTYRVEHVPPSSPSLGRAATEAVERAPAWLKDRLAEQIVALGWAPIRAAKVPGRIALGPDDLRVRDGSSP